MILSVNSAIKDDNNNLYVLDEIIGQGGFGYVFKAHRKKDDAIFAVKTTFPSFGDNSSILSFKNEICTAAKIFGDNIIKYEYVHDGDKFPEFPPYIIMEYANGGTLRKILEKKRRDNQKYSNEELINIFSQLANGMRQINNCIIHRDIKPDNILLCGNTLKISDFGLSKVAVENTRTMSFKGSGTPWYMAPEAWNLSKNTIQMDIYSMGIVFYELAALQYPYSPKPRTQEECKNAHLYSTIMNLNQSNVNLSPSLISVINRMLEKNIKRRFNNWDEIIEIIETQNQSNSQLDKLVAMAVSAKNSEDLLHQQNESAKSQKECEKKEFLKLVNYQFENVIVEPIIRFSDEFNKRYAGFQKIKFVKHNQVDSAFSSWELFISNDNIITINLEIILKENHTRKIRTNRFERDFYECDSKEENYIPQYRGKNILAWCEIVNSYDFGFNLILIENDNIYGDWIIITNKNNFSLVSGKERKEPFAFSLQELPNEIIKAQSTHLYTSDFNKYIDDKFLQLIKSLSFDLKF